MQAAFIRKGHGYDARPATGHWPAQERCTAFDGFDVIAEPLGGFSNADRESRVWHKPGASYGVTYGSHAIKLAVEAGDRPRGLFILMENGAGREVLALATGPDWEAVRDTLLALDTRTLYALLYSVWQTADNARRTAESETRNQWARAFVDGLIRKRRQNNRLFVEIETADEKARRMQRRAA